MIKFLHLLFINFETCTQKIWYARNEVNDKTSCGVLRADLRFFSGGRNVTVSLQSRTGHTNMLAVVGALVFTQYWYWFPLAHCLALAFTPTCLIALNAQLKMPKLDIKSNARPSIYAYPAPLEEKKREEREKVTTAVLSIAARARRRETERKARDSHEKMEVVS